MDPTVILAFVAGGVVLLALAWWFSGPKVPRGARLPPCKGGWLPWAGCMFQFGKEPLTFLQRTKKELGSDIFTILAAGKRMTFVTNPKDYSTFFSTPEFNFQAVVQPFCQRAAGVPKETFYKQHSSSHDKLRNLLTPNQMVKLTPSLSQLFYASLCMYDPQGQMDLFDFVRKAMFRASTKHLYGEVSPKTQEAMWEFHQQFMIYDDKFEQGAQVPEFLLGNWGKSKHWLWSVFSELFTARRKERASGKECPAMSVIEETVDFGDDGKSAPSYALLLLWGSQANAIPSAYWTLLLILSHPEVYRKAKEELKSLKLVDDDGQFCPISDETLASLKYLRRCAMEGVRLYPVGAAVRMVTKTRTLNGYTIPEGDTLVISPFWSHRNPEKFPDPEKYDPDRWLNCDLDKKQVLDGFVAFGGGRYQCPGRWYALMEINLFAVMALKMFDFEVLDPTPQIDPVHLVGVPHPQSACRAQYKRCSE